jgi:hypothetical protein
MAQKAKAADTLNEENDQMLRWVKVLESQQINVSAY